MNGRHQALALVLAATVLAAFWPMPEEATVEPVVRATGARGGADPALSTQPLAPAVPDRVQVTAVAQATSPADALPARNLFPAQHWGGVARARDDAAPAESRKPQDERAEPEAPPAIPLRYVGHWQENGQLVGFFAQGTQLRKLMAGDVVDGVWRVQALTPTRLTLRYLPLNIEQTLEWTP